MAKQNKPAIRFKGFTDAWEQRKVQDVAFVSTGFPFDSKDFSNDGDFLVITNGNIQDASPVVDDSLGNRISIDDNKIKSAYLLKIGDILVTMDGTVGRTAKVIINGQILAQRVGRLKAFNSGNFLYQWLNTGTFSKEMSALSHGGTIKHISLDEIRSYEAMMPQNSDEQEKIGKYFDNLDNLITLHQRKYDKLQVLKKAMLEKMFPKNGSRVPEIRFKGFTDAWEQRKFSELVQIERGGSPRPIDDFITDAPNGLNWVKIGDAPTQGNYITKTAEKIRPEGLSKTREVHPGDLILSNSMSFGKPYIMGIDGCIHDGWLLIRNTYEVFDLTFLCHLLGTPQMLSQYRSLAAGSTVNNLNKELVGNTVITIPSITEQRVLGDYLEQLDHLITLHQRELEKLQNIKKSMLEKMFV